MRVLQSCVLACASAFVLVRPPVPPRVDAPVRHAADPRGDNLAEYDASPTKPNEKEDYVFPGALVEACDDHGQWYVAEVVDCDATTASVKYVGWEDWPIETLSRDRLGYMPKPRIPVPDEMLPPAEFAAKMLATKREREMYQVQKFREAFCGTYVTTGERHALTNGALTLQERFAGALTVEKADDKNAPTAYDGWRVSINEARDRLALGEVVLKPADFDGLARGTMEVGGLAANGEAFSFARADETRLACDVWLAAAGQLLQCRAVYEAGALAYLDVARLVKAGAEAVIPAARGTGLFDVHPKLTLGPLAETYAEVRLAGRATAACLVQLQPDGGGVLSVDWHAPGAEMRVQVDRVFQKADGAIASLEITDVLADQADQYAGVHANIY